MAFWNTHLGAWGTPEFGITEKIGSLFNAPKTSEGGSNVLGGAYPAAGYGGTQPLPASQSLPYTGTSQPYQPQPQQTQAPTGGGGGVPYPNPSNDWQNEQNRLYNEQNQQSSGPSQADVYNQQMRGEIEGGYNQYFGELDNMLNELPTQRTAQEGIVGSQFTQGVSDLEAEKSMGLADLGMQRQRTETNQAKNLSELAESISNQFQAGQVKLGAVGAGDSSAVGQYSYALSKLGSKARGNLMSQTSGIQSEIDNREFKLNTIFSTEKTRLASSRNENLLKISTWFSEATNRIREMKAQGQISKGQDLAAITRDALNIAMQQVNQVQQNYQNQQNQLQEWALNNSADINQVRQNMASVGSYNPAQPQAQTPQGQIAFAGQPAPAQYGGGGISDEERQRQQGYFA